MRRPDRSPNGSTKRRVGPSSDCNPVGPRSANDRGIWQPLAATVVREISGTDDQCTNCNTVDFTIYVRRGAGVLGSSFRYWVPSPTRCRPRARINIPLRKRATPEQLLDGVELPCVSARRRWQSSASRGPIPTGRGQVGVRPTATRSPLPARPSAGATAHYGSPGNSSRQRAVNGS